MLLSIDYEDFDLLKLISVAVREMSEGELLQIEKSRKLDITEEIYFEIIRQKTATLIAACCAIGASSVGAEKEEVELMHKFGNAIGIAFQIKDDLFDYSEEKIGKPTGIDIKERKMTLPLIHSLNQASPKKRKWMINTVKNHNQNKKRVKELIEYVKTSGGLIYTEKMMNSYHKEALDILDRYPESPYKNSLELMVDYVINRKI
jgi:octaprenyl-diphosphate synthase